jgi:hypothetical protein
MQAIEAAAPAKDGVACFTRLYQAVTQDVHTDLGAQTFADPGFLSRLDVTFANLFFGALDTYGTNPAAAPHAWAPLFAARASGGIAPLQFALAGMNAHINRDLPVALVTTCKANGADLSCMSPDHGDFEHVNLLLAAVERELKTSFLTGWLGWVDRIVHRLGGIDDIVAMWDISRARDAAWANARALWALEPEPQLSADYLGALDSMVGFTNRALLASPRGVVERLARAVARALSRAARVQP